MPCCISKHIVQSLASGENQTMAAKQCHVVMLPWLAFGHIIPFLELSKKLCAKGVRVTFISTPKNIQRLPFVPPDLADLLKLVALPLTLTDNLPADCEATIDIEAEQVQYLKKAYDGLRVPLEKILSDERPDFLFFDFVACWIPETAARFGVPCCYFSAYSASTLGYMGPPAELRSWSQRTTPEDFTRPPKWFNFPSLVCFRPDQAARVYHGLKFPDISGMSTGQRIATTLEGCDFVTIRSCVEFEESYLDLLQELYHKPVLPVGLLPRNLLSKSKNQSRLDPQWSSTFNWLDNQAQKSVTFVGFGTEYKMPIEQVHELALGIQLSDLNFIWLLRKPEGIDASEYLPSGFLAETSTRGLVCFGWAPQHEILSHPAIGGCLFHSGWGSIIESLGFGHPQILIPMVADQRLNARLLVEKGIGYEVPRNEDGSFDRYAVASSMKQVMLNTQSRPLREKAAEMQRVFANHELHDDYINILVQFLSNYKKGNQ